MLKLKRNKKGSAFDIIFIGVVLLFFSMMVLIGFKVVTELNAEFQASDTIDTHGKTASASLVTNYSGALDNGFLFLAIGLAIVTLVLAALVRVHPVFIIFFLIFLVITIIVCAMFSNVYQEMAANPNLSAQADDLTFISLIMEYLPFIIGIFGMVLMVIMYKLWRTANE